MAARATSGASAGVDVVDDTSPESALAQLIGSRQEFIAGYWNRHPTVRRGPGDGYPELLTLSDLDTILSRGGLREPYVRLSAGGRPLHESRFMRPAKVRDAPIRGVLDVDKMAAEFDAGATVILDGIDHYQLAVKRLCDRLGAELRADAGAVAFLSPPEVPGLTPHFDNTEVFVLQLHGSKHWKVYEQIRPLPRTGRVLSIEELGEPVLDVELRAGDCLYIPWGAPHSTVTGATVSCHLSVMVSPLTWGDILSRTIDTTLATDRFEGVQVWRDGDGDWLLPEAERRLRTTIERLEAIETGSMLDEVTRPVGLRAATRHGFLQQTAKRQELSRSTVLSRQEALDFQHRVVDGTVELRVGRSTFRYPGAAAATLDALATKTSVMVSELPTDLEENALLKMIGHLVEIGAVRIS